MILTTRSLTPLPTLEGGEDRENAEGELREERSE